MHQQPQGDSIWGNINTVIEVALNVYYIFAENSEGIMIPKDKAKDTVSEKAAAAGSEDNGYLCYGKDENMDIPMYEVLQRRVAACEKIKAQAIEQMREIKRDGSLRLTDYFGECEPPVKTVDGEVEKLQKVRNGIYFASTGDATYFAVHEDVTEKFMAVSRPVDISPLINDLTAMLKNSDEKRKELLRQEILQMSSYALSGEIVERQFYISLWDKYEDGIEKDIYKRAALLAEKFTTNGIGCEVIGEKEIVRLINLVHNPSYVHLKDTETAASILVLR